MFNDSIATQWRKGLFMLLLVVAGMVQAQAQTNKISGQVTDEQGLLLSGVTVSVKGTAWGTATDSSGHYTLAATGVNDTLVFSNVGYLPLVTAVAGRSTIDVQLEKDARALDNVVVVGYARQQKTNVTSAVGTIQADDISRRVTTNLQQSLQGLAPGLTVLDRGGSPGKGNTSIRLRGVTTLSGNDPLILVDGIEQGITNMNPDDIESVSILKDAAATSIYGSRAAAGVILITTKRGKKGDLNVSYDGYYAIQKIGNHPEHLNTVEHMIMQNVAYENAGRATIYPDTLIESYRTSTDRILYPLANDWYNALYHTAPQYNNNLTISGGGDKVSARLSIRHFQQDGIVNNYSNNSKEIRLNTDFKPSDKFSFSLDANYRKLYTTTPRVTDDYSDAFYYTLHASEFTVPRYPDGGYGLSAKNVSPLAIADLSGYGHDYFDNIWANLRGEWNILKGLKLSVQYGINSTFDRNELYANAYSVVDEKYPSRISSNPVNSFTTSRGNGYMETLNELLTYHLETGKHQFNVLGGYSQIYSTSSGLSASRNTFYNNSIQSLSSGDAGTQTNSGSNTQAGLRSYFGRINYQFDNKYLLELNGRYDGSSNFTDDNLYSFFPSFSAGWRISQESFWQSIAHVLPEFKIRGSYGETGNQTVGAYSFYQALSNVNYTFSGESATGYTLTNYANAGLQWETTRQTDLGFDAGLLSNKLTVSFDYYNKKTEGILLSLPVSAVVGLNAPVQNAGSVSNKGWEVAINYRDHDHAVKYDLSLNVSNNINKVLDLKGTGPYFSGSVNIGYYITQEGLPIESLWGYQTAGYFKDATDVDTSATLDPNTYAGDLKYVDRDGDGDIDANDMTKIGDPFPHYTYGFTSNFQYKGFDLYLFLQGALQQDYRVGGALAEAGNYEGFVVDIAGDYWTPDNTDARFPRPQKSSGKNSQTSDFWIIKAGYLRVKNIQLGYTIPRTLTDKLKIKRARFYVGGTNLLTASKANEWGLDPEFPSGRGNYYPQTKSYTIGTQINF